MPVRLRTQAQRAAPTSRPRRTKPGKAGKLVGFVGVLLGFQAAYRDVQIDLALGYRANTPDFQEQDLDERVYPVPFYLFATCLQRYQEARQANRCRTAAGLDSRAPIS